MNTEAIRTLTIPAALVEASTRHPAIPAIIDVDGSVTTYDRLATEVEEARTALTYLGIGRGDRVAIWAPNSAQWIRAALAVYSSGATLVPINTRYRGEEVADILERSSARLLFTTHRFLDTDYVDTLRQAGVSAGLDHDAPARAPELESVVVLSTDDDQPPPGTTDWSTLVTAGLAAPPSDARSHIPPKPQDCCTLLFTSGTTGRSKGAILSHESTVRAYADWADLIGLVPGDRLLILNPLFHSFGLHSGLIASVLGGATMIPEPVFEIDRLAERLESEQVTVLPAPPTVYQGLLDWAAAASHRPEWPLRVAITGATTIPVSLIRGLHEDLALDVVLTGYGLTECTGIATMCRPGDPLDLVAGTSGRAVEGVEVVVVDDHGSPTDPGEPGEVLVRGYNVMAGYLDDPEQTREAIDQDGWLHTGDVGVMDGSGNLQITDRIKDMFIVGGFNAYPAEIERVLLEHPAIADVAVVGVFDKRLGETGAAFAVLQPGGVLTIEDLTAWARERMANFKVPRRLVEVSQLPRNATGKVDKVELRLMANDEDRSGT